MPASRSYPHNEHVRPHSALGWMKRNPSAVLLTVQLLSIALYPYLDADNHLLTRTILSIIGVVVLAMAILAVRPTPAQTWVSTLLGLPVVMLTFADAFTEATWIHILSDGLHAVFYAWTCLSLIRYMFSDADITSDEFFATGATFTVAVWAYAYGYSLVQTIFPLSFTGIHPGQPLTWMELLFLSTTTMTNTGLSDIVPVGVQGRSIVMLEQISGIMYLALVVSRVVNLGGPKGIVHRVRESSHSS